MTVDLARPAITTLVGDMLGAGNFSGKPNALAPPGLRLEREGADGVVCGSSDAPAPASFKWTVLSNTSELGSVRLDGIADCAATPLAVESWTLFNQQRRFFRPQAMTPSSQSNCGIPSLGGAAS